MLLFQVYWFTIMGNALNILLIVIDALRPDHLGCYGYQRETSPELDKIAGEGVKFHKVLSQSSWTKPAVASLLTATYPEVHGVKRVGDVLAYQATSLPALLRQNGYITACIQTNPFLTAESGFHEGFDHYVELYDPSPGVYKTPVQEATKTALDWLHHFGKKPFFLYLHLLDTHNPYIPPEPFRGFGSEEQDLFDGEIRSIDFHIGLLRDYLCQTGILDKTVLVITADHGEEFQEHGRRYHAKHLYEEVLRVPLIISLPALLSSGLSIPAQVRSIDIVPTILEILGFPPFENHQGESLLPLLSNEPSSDRPAVSQIGADGISPATEGEIIALTTGDHKLIWHKKDDTRELYDLSSDPRELHNLAAEDEASSRRLQSQLEQLIYAPEDKPFRPKRSSRAVRFDDDVLVRLKALGYIE